MKDNHQVSINAEDCVSMLFEIHRLREQNRILCSRLERHHKIVDRVFYFFAVLCGVMAIASLYFVVRGFWGLSVL